MLTRSRRALVRASSTCATMVVAALVPAAAGCGNLDAFPVIVDYGGTIGELAVPHEESPGGFAEIHGTLLNVEADLPPGDGQGHHANVALVLENTDAFPLNVETTPAPETDSDAVVNDKPVMALSVCPATVPDGVEDCPASASTITRTGEKTYTLHAKSSDDDPVAIDGVITIEIGDIPLTFAI